MENKEPTRYRTPLQKLQAAEALFWNAKALKEAYLKQQNPDWSEEKVKQQVRNWMLYGRS